MSSMVSGRSLEELESRAVYHGVGNLVFLSLRSLPGLDPEPVDQLGRRYVGGNLRHLQALGDLACLGQTFTSEGIPWLVFKGPVLGELVYPRPDLRSYRDLDIVVPRADFGAAVMALEAAGAKLLDRNWEFLLERRVGQLHFELPMGTLADVHWHVLNRGEMRRSLSVSMDGLLRRARQVELNGTSLLTFEPVDSLLHLCVHAAVSGAVRLVWMKDIERAIAAGGIDWDEFCDRAREWQAAGPIAAVLARVRRVLDFALPDAIMPRLSSSPWGRAADRAVDALWPVESLTDAGGPAASWMRYRRDSFATGRRTLLARRASQRALEVSGGEDEETTAVTIFRPSGDDTTKARFFELVRAGDER
jgi:hypothetical protein